MFKSDLLLKFSIQSLLILIIAFPFTGNSQTFTHQDTLRGSITAERSWWDLTHYDLSVKVDPENKFISGINIIKFKVLEVNKVLQIDLQEPMKISKIIYENAELPFRKYGNAWYVDFPQTLSIGEAKEINVYFEGNPQSARNAPWDGGFSWKKDDTGKDFIATSCQGLGASIWWPCKDHMYDEPENMWIRVTAPDHLTAVANGRLKKMEKHKNNTKTFHWYVLNPINNYGVNINIGDYVHFSEKYNGEKGILDCDYYVLKYNLEKARIHFQDVSMMLKAFEYWFGPYPFYEDGYKLVEVPYLGMEHQSSVTYGNKYLKGYLGRDRSKSGWGLKFDYIIIHESGHEWFANSITYKDIADMWIHESFTTYSENLFLDFHFGKQASSEYVLGTREEIKNDKPIIGQYGVNQEGSGDMYAKGSNMLHTLRQLVNDDEKWRELLRGLNKKYFHKVVTTQQIEKYLSDGSGINLQPFFDQYLRDVRIPVLAYVFDGETVRYRWTNCAQDFEMKLRVVINNSEKWISPTTSWKTYQMGEKVVSLKIDPDFYVAGFNLTGK